MAERIVRVCDLCERTGVPAQTYVISRSEAGDVSVDLCAQHARPIEKVVDQAYGDLPKPEKPGRRSSMKIVTMDEVARLRRP